MLSQDEQMRALKITTAEVSEAMITNNAKRKFKNKTRTKWD